MTETPCKQLPQASPLGRIDGTHGANQKRPHAPPRCTPITGLPNSQAHPVLPLNGIHGSPGMGGTADRARGPTQTGGPGRNELLPEETLTTLTNGSAVGTLPASPGRQPHRRGTVGEGSIALPLQLVCGSRPFPP
eukprot:7456029-Pyramimonas_sp.AAC.1